MTAGRYGVTDPTPGEPLNRGWWGREATARRKYTACIGEHDARPDARVILIDEGSGRVLTEWPEHS